MGILTLEHSDRLFWLGRYTERVYTSAKQYARSFDDMIDHQADSYMTLCRQLDIPNIYADKSDFLTRFCFDETDPNSIAANLLRAYDNAIVLREEIGSEPLSYIQLAVYEMSKARLSQAPLIELQRMADDILAFWGIVDDLIESENARNIIKTGKRVERLDLYGRLHASKRSMLREIHRLQGRLPKTCLPFAQKKLDALETYLEGDEPNWRELVQAVDTLVG